MTTTPEPRHGGLVTFQPGTDDFTRAVLGWISAQQSPHTQRAYRGDLMMWDAWLDWVSVPWLGVKPSHLDLFGAAVRDGEVRLLRGVVRVGESDDRRRAPTTVTRRMGGVSSFYEYLVAEGITERNLVYRRRKGQKVSPPPLYLDKDAAKAVAEAAMSMPIDQRLLVQLLLFTGMRVSEALALNVDDVRQIDGHWMVVLKGKGGKYRNTALVAPIVATLQERPGDGPLIRSGEERMTYDQAAYTVHVCGKRAGVRRITPHQLRHTWATQALRAGVPLDKVQDQLGHTDPKTTRRYAAGIDSLHDSPVYIVAGYLR